MLVVNIRFSSRVLQHPIAYNVDRDMVSILGSAAGASLLFGHVNTLDQTVHEVHLHADWWCGKHLDGILL